MFLLSILLGHVKSCSQLKYVLRLMFSKLPFRGDNIKPEANFNTGHETEAGPQTHVSTFERNFNHEHAQSALPYYQWWPSGPHTAWIWLWSASRWETFERWRRQCRWQACPSITEPAQATPGQWVFALCLLGFHHTTWNTSKHARSKGLSCTFF